VEQQLPTLLEHLSSPPVFSGVRVTRSLVLNMYVLWIVVCPFVTFLLAIVLSGFRFAVSDCPFDILKRFLHDFDLHNHKSGTNIYYIIFSKNIATCDEKIGLK